MNLARLFSYTRELERQLAEAKAEIVELKAINSRAIDHSFALLHAPPIGVAEKRERNVQTVPRPSMRGLVRQQRADAIVPEDMNERAKGFKERLK